MAASDYDRLGGEGPLRAIIDDFTSRVFGDVMIGFLFQGKPLSRIVEMEFRLAAEQLGGPQVYDGRSMHAAHRDSPIMGGHFQRRRMILENTLRAHGVADDIADRWLEHVDALRDQVLGPRDPKGCDHDTQMQ